MSHTRSKFPGIQGQVEMTVTRSEAVNNMWLLEKCNLQIHLWIHTKQEV